LPSILIKEVKVHGKFTLCMRNDYGSGGVVQTDNNCVSFIDRKLFESDTIPITKSILFIS